MLTPFGHGLMMTEGKPHSGGGGGTLDDPFDGPSLDAKWTRYNDGFNFVTSDIVSGRLRLQNSSPGLSIMRGIWEPLANGDFWVAIPFDMPTLPDWTGGIGGALYYSADGTAMTTVITFGFFRILGAPYFRAQVIGPSGTLGEIDLGSPATLTGTFDIQRTGNQITFRYSLDGSTWTTVYTLTDQTTVFTGGNLPNHIGPGVQSQVAAGTVTGYFDSVTQNA